MATAEDILEFWFGILDERGRADAGRSRRWWTKDPVFDREVRERFLADHEAIAGGRRDDWLDSPRSAVAWVIALDQFSRNMFRDTPRMFDYDEGALRGALRAIDAGFDRQLPMDMRTFLYMPLMHCEDLETQNRCVALFEAFRDELEGAERERIAGNLGFAIKHRDIVARFGRFPHRNPLLGRTSTGLEMEYLLDPGSGF